MATGLGSKRVSDFTPARATFLAGCSQPDVAPWSILSEHTNFHAEALESRDEHVRRAHPLHRLMAKDVAGGHHVSIGFAGKIPPDLQLSAVQRLINLPTLNQLHRFLRIVELHLAVLLMLLARRSPKWPATTRGCGPDGSGRLIRNQSLPSWSSSPVERLLSWWKPFA